MNQDLKKWFRQINIGIEECILALIIILNIFDAFSLLSSELDYIKKIISWSALGILMYKISPTEIISGNKIKHIDIALILSFFMLINKNLIFYAKSAITEATTLEPMFAYLIHNEFTIITNGIYIAFFLIILLALRLALLQRPKAPSIMHILYTHTKKNNFLKNTISYSLLFLLFFIIIFNTLLEWLAIAIDAPLLMIGLTAYITLTIRKHKKIKLTKMLTKLGSFGNSFYEACITHLRFKHTILHSLSGILVLHIFVESLLYMWPYIFNVGNKLYLNMLTTNHLWIGTLIQNGILQSSNQLNAITNIIVIFANTWAMFFLLISPVILWTLLFKKDKFIQNNLKEIQNPLHMKLFNGHIKPITIITLTALCLFVSTPIFQIQPITESALIGVDIYATDQIYLNSMWHIIFASAFITILSMLTYMLHKEDVLERILILASGIFFGTYCSLIVYSTTLYYTTTVLTLLYQQLYTLAILFGFFGIATILFYGLTGIYFLKKIIQTCSPQSLFKKKQMKN